MAPFRGCAAMNGELDDNIRYMQQVIAWQPRLYAFVLSLLGNREAADDVLQNANLALLKKQAQFHADADFGVWAMRIARIEVRRHWDATARDKRRFDDALMEQLAARAERLSGEPAGELQFLRQCMAILSDQERALLAERYGGRSVGQIAETCGRSVASISQTLYRIRGKLAECVKRAINAERRNDS
jgi:RNA polymerase sigma-70 factor (ECF subfamily)